MLKGFKEAYARYSTCSGNTGIIPLKVPAAEVGILPFLLRSSLWKAKETGWTLSRTVWGAGGRKMAAECHTCGLVQRFCEETVQLFSSDDKECACMAGRKFGKWYGLNSWVRGDGWMGRAVALCLVWRVLKVTLLRMESGSSDFIFILSQNYSVPNLSKWQWQRHPIKLRQWFCQRTLAHLAGFGPVAKLGTHRLNPLDRLDDCHHIRLVDGKPPQ